MIRTSRWNCRNILYKINTDQSSRDYLSFYHHKPPSFIPSGVTMAVFKVWLVDLGLILHYIIVTVVTKINSALFVFTVELV